MKPTCVASHRSLRTLFTLLSFFLVRLPSLGSLIFWAVATGRFVAAMFVHAGASLHGHEYSAPAQAHQHLHHPPARPIPLLRSALRPLSEIADSHTQEVSPPTRRSFTEPTIPSAATYVTRRRPASEIVSKKDLSVRFMEPDMSLPSPSPSATLLASDDDESVAGSEFTVSTTLTRSSTTGTKRRKIGRRSTRYAMAQPAPQLLTKQRTLVQIRPRLLLQLQKLGERRATPAFDVVPSSIISGSIIIPKLTTRLPRLFSKKPHLGQDDLLILRSENYSEDCENVNSGHATFGDRELLAVISPLPELGDDRSEIIMEDGSVWTTDRNPNGSYEFTSTDILGKPIVARWVKRSINGPRAKTTQGGADGSPLSTPPLPEYKWTFSIIDPQTRRHPIMGVIMGSELEIYDTYNTLSTSSGIFPPTKPFNLSSEPSSPSWPLGAEERLTEFVPERYKKLMAATASWISLRSEGWPASLNPKMRRGQPCRNSHGGASTDAERRRTFPFAERPQASNMTTAATTQTPPDKESALRTSSPESLPRRSLSTGAAFMRSRGVLAEPVERSYTPEQENQPAHKSYRPKVVHHSDHLAEEKTHTCRIKVLKMTRRLFHRKECQAE